MDVYDVAIIGGGVVGCATLFELTCHGYACVLLEKNSDLVGEASSGNSGMLHTGFDARAGSVELDCIQNCQSRIHPLLDQLGVPSHRIGATMVAWNQQQLDQLPAIAEKSRVAGISAVWRLSAPELYQREPHLQDGALGGLVIPGEVVTDPWLLPILLANDARRKGAQIRTNAKVTSCDIDGGYWQVDTGTGQYRRARCVVNCAGLYGDVVDKLADYTNFSIKPRKGQYIVYEKASKGLINSSILPVPSETSKGIIIFRSIYDNVIVGPTAEDVESRRRPPIEASITRRLSGHADRTVKTLTKHNIVGMYTGVRPATQYKDYVIKGYPDRQWVTVGGIRSTGVSGSLGIASKVRHLLLESLNLEPSKGANSLQTQPEYTFTRHGSVVVDGHIHNITHPITLFGRQELNSRI